MLLHVVLAPALLPLRAYGFARMYGDYVARPDDFDWIVDPGLFPHRFPKLWARVSEVAMRQGDSSGLWPAGAARP